MGMTIKYPVNNRYFDEWSSNMAYVLGFTITDGCLHHRQCGRKSTLYYNIKDLEILEFIQKEISPTRPIYNAIYKANPKYNLPERTGFALRIPIDDEAVNRLEKLGVIARKTGFQVCPNNILKEFFGDYLRGVFDGDGSLYKSKSKYGYTMNICSKNRSFLDEINIYIENIGHIYKYIKKDFYGLVIYKKEYLIKMHKLLYKDENCFSLTRKKQIFDKVLTNENNNNK